MSFLTSQNLPALVMMNHSTTNIEKVQFIASFGIRRPPLRWMTWSMITYVRSQRSLLFLLLHIWLSVCLFGFLSVCPFGFLSVCLFGFLSVCLSAGLFGFLSVYLSVCLSICLSVLCVFPWDDSLSLLAKSKQQRIRNKVWTVSHSLSTTNMNWK